MFDVAETGNMVMLRALVRENAGNDAVLNWANPLAWKAGYTALHVSSVNDNVEAVRLLARVPGKDKCGLSLPVEKYLLIFLLLFDPPAFRHP